MQLCAVFFFGICMGMTLAQTQVGLCDTYKTDIVVALDNSNQVDKNQFTQIKSHTSKFLKRLVTETCDVDVLVRIITFGTKVYTQDTLVLYGTDTFKVLQDVDNLPYRGDQNLNMSDPFVYAHATYLEPEKRRTGAKSLFVYIGHAETGITSAALYIVSLRARWHYITSMAVHVKDTLTGDERTLMMSYISRKNSRHLFSMGEEITYERVLEKLIKDCNECYKPTMDFATLLDNSHGSARFTKMKRMVKSMANRLPAIGSLEEQNRISVTSFGDGVYTKESFGLNNNTDRTDLIRAIDNLSYTRTNVSAATGAFDYVLSNVMTSAKTRKNANKFIVLFTYAHIHRVDIIPKRIEATTRGIRTITVGYPYYKRVTATTLAGESYMAIDARGIFKWHPGAPDFRTTTDIAKIILHRSCFKSVFG